MTYELVLISVVMAGGYWGQFFVRTRPHGSATFGLMLLALSLFMLCQYARILATTRNGLTPLTQPTAGE